MQTLHERCFQSVFGTQGAEYVGGCFVGAVMDGHADLAFAPPNVCAEDSFGMRLRP